MPLESTEVWAGWYRDRRGAEAVTITARAGQLRTLIRGSEYTGGSFAAIGPAAGGAPLPPCVLEWDMPLPVHTPDGSVQHATLSCLLTLGEVRGDGSRDRTDLSLTLHLGGAAYESGVVGGDFDDALSVIRRQLPPGTELGSSLAPVEA
ncbi:DUF6304 family protein [Streptomyces sp. PR69]|uniref:DUF6304 family protein n=1 Tax=Streptomyces sp. PR69 TaxID=2984950 RepID=UPI0022643F76|nr:DUF6304 family protein [Streptomyces sp. PR69]